MQRESVERIGRRHTGALLLGRILLATFFFVDGVYKCSVQAWPSYRQFMFDSFKALGVYNNYSYGGMADVTAVVFCISEIVGSVLLALGWREAGTLILCVYLVVENALQNGEFLLMRGVNMLKFIPFLRNLALVGGLIVSGAHEDHNIGGGSRDTPNSRIRQLQKHLTRPEFDPNATPLKEL